MGLALACDGSAQVSARVLFLPFYKSVSRASSRVIVCAQSNLLWTFGLYDLDGDGLLSLPGASCCQLRCCFARVFIVPPRCDRVAAITHGVAVAAAGATNRVVSCKRIGICRAESLELFFHELC